MKKILPAPLQKGDKVGIIAPAGPITEKQMRIAVAKVEKAGYVPVCADGLTERFGYLAGCDEYRAKQINTLFADKSIKAILAARGGYGCTRILDMIDYELIKENPKIIGGYSDLTALICAIYKKTGLVTFHSSMLVPDETDYSKNSMWDIFENGLKNYRITCEETHKQNKELSSQQPTVLKSGKCRGTLFGGNLTLLQSLLDTEYDFYLNNKILFLEEINEPPYKVDRMLTHLKNAGKLRGIRGIIFGIMKGCEAQGNESLSLDYVIEDFIKDLNIPVVKNFTFGHVQSRCTFPIGVKALLDTDKMEVKLLEGCVE